MPTLNAVNVGPNLGPVYIKPQTTAKRDHYEPVLNETCLQNDRVFQDKTSQQIISFQDYIYTNPSLRQVIPAPQQTIRDYRKMMREHMERRILFMFQQLIVCYQTKLHFESVGAQDQGKSPDAIVVNIQGHQHKYAVRNAAHSSSNPCLVAYDNVQWQLFQSGAAEKPQGFVFLKDTDYYRTVNATMNMPRWMNETDREVDEKTRDSLLRKIGDEIINKASQGLITPDQGIVEYVREALNEVQKAQVRLANQNKHPEVREVLTYYEKYINKIQITINTNPLFLENFLSLKMGQANQNDRSKRVLLQMRYAAIRNCQINQSALIQKVERLSQEILNQVKALNKHRKPDYFDAAFRTLLIEQARSDDNRQRLEKLFNFSPSNFASQLNTSARTKFNTATGFLAAYSNRINFLARDILEDMRKLRVEEMYQRAQTIKELRAMKQWSQRKLGQEIKQIFPLAAASQSTICRIENRTKLVTEQIAQEFSSIFGVDSGLFMPHFYYA